MSSRIRSLAGLLLPVLAVACTTPSPQAERSPAAASRISSDACRKASAYATRLAIVDPKFYATARTEELLAVEALIVDLVKFTNVVKKSFELYHWAPRAQVQAKTPTKLHDPAGYRYFRAKVDRFNVNRDMGSMMGNGLYSALDPVATTSYGGGDPLLVTVHMKPGTRFMDVRNFQLRDQTSAALKLLGCSYDSGFETAMERDACGKYFKLAMLALEVGAIEYGYNSSLDCESRQTAFVVLRSASFDAADVGLLMPATSDLSDTETRDAALAVYRLAGAGTMSGTGFTSPWKSTFGDETSYRVGQPDYEKLRAERLMTCPSVADHAVPLGSWVPKDVKKVARKTESDLAEHEKVQSVGTALSSVYCGEKLIRLQTVEFKRRAADAFTQSYSLSNFRTFCDGTPACTYGVEYVSEVSSAAEGEGAELRAKWECLGPDGKPDVREKTFPLPQYRTIELDCATAKK
jgi:hypothetical protein